ncbi:MAG: hypothetical protein GY811_08675 [Myxococcales bacterium]|nr:hypothetical protein [Myxococcales bacterium]
MSDFPEKEADKTNAPAVLVVGLATTAVLWAFIVYLQAYFETTEGEIAAMRAVRGKTVEVRGLHAEQRADLGKTTYADASKGTLKRLKLETAMSLVVRDAKGNGSLIPSLGALDVATIPAASGFPVKAAPDAPTAPEPTDATPSTDGAAPAAATPPTEGAPAADAPPTEGAAAAPPEAAAPAAGQ